VAIAEQVGVDTDDARRDAELAKADLQSRMVGEFPELQGIMGRYYASAKGETGPVADAIDHAYQPRFAGDAIAQSKLGQVLAIAERLDTLAGGFAAGLKPTGSKDAFALRRNGLGLARTLLEKLYESLFTTEVLQHVGWEPEAWPSVARHLRSMPGVKVRRRDGRRGSGRQGKARTDYWVPKPRRA